MFWVSGLMVLISSPTIAGFNPIFPRSNEFIRSPLSYVQEMPETRKSPVIPRSNEFIRSPFSYVQEMSETRKSAVIPRSNEFIRSPFSYVQEMPETNKFVTTWRSAVNAAITDHSEPEYAPIVERNLEFYEFKFASMDGSAFDLRAYLKGKSLVVIEYFAGWCQNSNRNGHVIERLWTKYRDKGLGVVGVAEYSDEAELRIHINRIGTDYPVVVETQKLGQRKDSSHYKYRHAVGDKRKWGTPFYVIINARDVEPSGANGPIARKVYTVSGELEEESANQFFRKILTDRSSLTQSAL
jgi:hypothetical protein